MKKLDLTLYLVTDSTYENQSETDFLDTIEQSCKGGVTLVQVREKNKSGLEYYELAKKVKQITDRYDIPLIIDDRVDIAMAIDAAGVHVGQSDIPVYAARKLLGDSKIVGATAKTVEQAVKAKSEGADYFGVGAIYPTTTKVVTVLTEVSMLNKISAETNIPIAAIGGLNGSNMHVLYDSEASGVAVVSAIMKSDNPYETAKSLRKQIVENFKNLAAFELSEHSEIATSSFPIMDLDLTSRLTTKYYVAYGSNMNARIMYRRCKRAKKIGTTYIEDWKLTMPFYADIEPSAGDRVPALVWEIDLDDEACLDMCEGVPTLYTKSELTVEVDGKTLTVLVYIMTEEYKNSGRKPKDGYVESIVQGYEDCGFCTESLKGLVAYRIKSQHFQQNHRQSRKLYKNQ